MQLPFYNLEGAIKGFLGLIQTIWSIFVYRHKAEKINSYLKILAIICLYISYICSMSKNKVASKPQNFLIIPLKFYILIKYAFRR